MCMHMYMYMCMYTTQGTQHLNAFRQPAAFARHALGHAAYASESRLEG